jgi:Fe-S-cluster containining protein
MSHYADFYLTHRKEIDQITAQILPLMRKVQKLEGTQALCDWVNFQIDAILKKTDLQNKISCSKGCSFCCSGKIILNTFEASYITSYVEQFDIEFDRELVKAQSKAPNIDDLKFAQNKCALLDKKGNCSIYDIRPAICRTYNSTSPPDKCDKDKHGEIDIRDLKTPPFFAFQMAYQLLDLELGNIDKNDEYITLHKALNHVFN